MQLEFAVSSVNTGIAAAVAQLNAAIPNVKFLVLDWYSLTEAFSELCGIEDIASHIGAGVRMLVVSSTQRPLTHIEY